tara:strand:- start:1025 stop:1327 length:303 start_codon:yes stop_codon:yes gene_type:complete
MEFWYNHIHWTEEAHQEFYEHFKKAPPHKQSEALLHQALLLSQSGDDTDLKFGESLLIQWMSIFRKTEEKKKAYTTLITIYGHLNLPDKVNYFKKLIADL